MLRASSGRDRAHQARQTQSTRDSAYLMMSRGIDSIEACTSVSGKQYVGASTDRLVEHVLRPGVSGLYSILNVVEPWEEVRSTIQDAHDGRLTMLLSVFPLRSR